MSTPWSPMRPAGSAPSREPRKWEASSIGDTLEDVIRERPLSMAAIALGLGFLVGVTWPER